MGVGEAPGRILVVDDDAAVASAIAQMIQVLGRGVAQLAASCADARIRLVDHSALCGVILDVSLPDGDGLDLLAGLRRAGGRVPVLVLTGLCVPEVASRAKALEARYVVKPPVAGELEDFILRVARGGVTFANELRAAAERIAGRRRLTPRQAEILHEAALDDRREVVALELGMHCSTLKTHLTAIFERTGTENLRQLGALVRGEALRGPGD